MSAIDQTQPTSQRIDYAATLSNRQKMTTLLGVLLTMFLAALDQTIVATAQPAIVAQFNAIHLISWVTTGYLLSSTAMVPIFGKLSDLYGRKLILMIGALVFVTGSALCGTSQSMIQLILWRVLQGIGAAGIVSVSMAVPADLWVPAERAKVSGIIVSVFGLAGVIGPFLGGLLTDSISWRAVFYVNVPVGIVALTFVMLKMPRLASGIRAAIDWAGTVALLTAVLPLLLALTLDKDAYAWDSPLILGLFALAAVSTAIFLWVETKAVSPLLPLTLFNGRVFTVSVVASLLFGAAFFGSIIYLAMFLVGVLNVTATKAGSLLIPMMGGMVAGAITSTAATQRIGRYKPFLLIGVLITAAGLWLMSTMDVNTTLSGVTWRMVILGVGVGPIAPLLALAITNSVPFEQVGAATAGRSFFQSIGQTLAVAIFGVVMSTNLTHAMVDRMQPIVAGLPAAFQSKFDINQMVSDGAAESGESVPDIDARIHDEIAALFTELRTLIPAAIKDNNPDARAKLLANPMLPVEVKRIVTPGGLEAQVQKELDAQYDKIARTLKSGKPNALTVLQADKSLPAELRSALGQILPNALKNPQFVTALLAQMRQEMNAAKPAALAQAREETLRQALAAMDVKEQEMLAQGAAAQAQIPGQIRQAFAQQRALITAAIKDNDPDARAKLTASSDTPAELKQIVTPGALEARVKQDMDALYAIVEDAVNSGNPEVFLALQSNPRLPDQLRTGLRQAPASVVKNPLLARIVLQQVRDGLTEAEPAALAKAREEALSQALAALDVKEQETLAQGEAAAAQIPAKIRQGFVEQRALLTAAIRKNDAAAQAKLLANPETPAELRQVLAPGALDALVQKEMDTQYAKVAKAVKSGKVSAITALQADPQLPADLKKALSQLLPTALKNRQFVDMVLQEMHTQMMAAKPAALAEARQLALHQITTNLDAQEKELQAQGKVMGKKIAFAIKDSFAVSTTPIYRYAVYIALALWCLLLFLPEIPLAKERNVEGAVVH